VVTSPVAAAPARYRVPVRVLLVSTYELGHQPLHVASPAGTLLRAGHDVRAVDLSVEPLDPDAVSWADAVACSVPMHTATRLARAVCAEIRARRPDVALCLYGLYAGLDAMPGTTAGADMVISGEYETGLVAWVHGLAEAGRSRPRPARAGADLDLTVRRVVDLGRGRFGLPARHLLPPLERYARLLVTGEERLAGYVEASHGCAHRCRHCPVPVVYDGRTRLVGEEAVVADVAQLRGLGARHVTFGDPDFLNGPHHATRVVAAVHAAFPELTFDVTAKVEHVLRHRALWPRMADAGCLFVVSAFESTSPVVLSHLAKGHSAAEEVEAVAVLRASGIEPRPSLLPFTPWSTAHDMLELLDLVGRADLVGNVDPVQFAIRLLVPPGSLLLGSGALEGLLDDYDDEYLGWSWRSADARLDRLQEQLTEIAERAGTEAWPAAQSYAAVREATYRVLEIGAPGRAPDPEPGLRSALAPDDRPRLSEAWFCCAEPTGAQFGAVRAELPLAPVPAIASTTTKGC